MNKTFLFELKDQAAPNTPGLMGQVELDAAGSLLIYLDGYGDCCSVPGNGVPVIVEVWEGRPRVLIWSDINQESPTHVVELTGAAEVLYRSQNGPGTQG